MLLRNGKSVRQSAQAKGLPITRIETIADGTINPAKVGFANLDESDCADWLLHGGDILISHINSTKHLGKCAIYEGSPPALIHGMNLLALRVDPNVAESRYVYWMLSSDGFRRKLPRITKNSVNQSSFNISSFKELTIPVPPAAEQKRIVGILDAADALRIKRRKALVQLDTLTRSIFFDMFGDLHNNPMGWEMTTIGEITTCLDRMRKPVKEADRVSGDVPYYGANGQQGWINEALFNEPLVLVAEDGGHFDVPDRGVAYRIDGPSWVNNHAHVLRPGKTVDIEYLHRALRHYDFSPYISGSTRAKLNQAQLNKARLLLPPLDRQRRFAAVIESIENQRASQSAHLGELDTLFASLQFRAFRGEL